MRIEIRGGRIYDPAHGVDGEVRTIHIHDGLVAPPASPDTRADRVIDASGCVVFPGGVDIHCHIAGPAVNSARRLVREARQLDSLAAAGPGLRPGTGGIVPSTFLTGYRYAGMGYTTAIEAAVPPAGARQCHLELRDTPCIDCGMLLVLSDHSLVLESIRNGEPARLRSVVSQLLAETGAYGIKAVNPGGAPLWERHRRRVDNLDDPVDGAELTPRRIVRALANVASELSLPHPLHLHANGLGLPGNVETTVETVTALEGQAAHLAHVQFHAYEASRGKGGPALASGAARLATALAEHPEVTADVGQVWFGDALTLTSDRPVEQILWKLTGNRWVNLDSELETGCGMMPVRYRDRSRVHALQWAVGLELMLLSPDPWRLVLSTDHPNGASFLVYPRIIAALMDREYRREQLRRAPRSVRDGSALTSEIDREYSLYEVAIVTRAAPARILGLAAKGHLAAGADADLTIYDDDHDRVRMFESPRFVIKAGEILVEDGELRRPVVGTTFRADVARDPGAESLLCAWRAEHSTVHPVQHVLAPSEIESLLAVRAPQASPHGGARGEDISRR